MVNNKKLETLATEFVQAYLKKIRYMASSFSNRDWGFFPAHWFRPIKIEISHAQTDDIAIRFGDLAKSKTDLVKIVKFNSRIEESQFPNLNYNEWPFFKVPNGTHHSSFRGGTLSVGDHPVIILGEEVDFKMMDVRIESKRKGYPRERKLVWFFTVPNHERLSNLNRATEEAVDDFWDSISSVILTRTDDILSRSLTSDIIKLFIESLERLHWEYHSLITLEDIEEQRLQNFLESHFFLLDPYKSFTKEKRSVGNYLADFVLKYDDGHLNFVEVQLNYDPIMERGQPSKGFGEALKQIGEWFEWLETHESTTFSSCTGLIVVGHKKDYEKNKTEIDKKLTGFKRPVFLLTYDDLEKAFDIVRSRLENKKQE